MFRKSCALALCLLLAAMPLALADNIPSDQFFFRAKDALTLLAQGKNQEALEKLAFAYALPDDSDEKFLQFVKDYLPALNEQTVQIRSRRPSSVQVGAVSVVQSPNV